MRVGEKRDGGKGKRAEEDWGVMVEWRQAGGNEDVAATGKREEGPKGGG